MVDDTCVNCGHDADNHENGILNKDTPNAFQCNAVLTGNTICICRMFARKNYTS